MTTENGTMNSKEEETTPYPTRVDRRRGRAPREKKIWFIAMRDDEVFKQLLGQWGTEEQVFIPLDAFKNDGTKEEKKGESDENRSIESTSGQDLAPMNTFRSLASQLPFALRFQCERCLLDNAIVEVQQVQPPTDETTKENRREEIAVTARRLVFIFIARVLPKLREIDWTREVDSEFGVDLESFTLCELFGEAIWDALCGVKKAVKSENDICFDDAVIQNAMAQAKEWLHDAESAVGATEKTLANNGYFNIDLLRKRSKWPMAEYKCRFTVYGELLPTWFEIPKLHSYGCQPGSRRCIREEGWLVRDRFCRINPIDFDEPFVSNMVNWIASNPILCNRRYEFLFDKGVSTKTTIWLFSQHSRGMSPSMPWLEKSRDGLLSGLGCFKDVNEAKLGDRISLAFSETIPIVELHDKQIEIIPDIISNGYTFSDGCGVMGIAIAQKIKDVLKLRNLPGAVQVRIGGVKGMLSLKVDFGVDSIGIRPSMIKFMSSHRVLEVQCVAEAKAGDNKLFKEAIHVLHHLGVPAQVFRDLQERACTQFGLEYDIPDALEMVEEPRQSHRSKESKYLRNLLKNGTKVNNDLFSIPELNSIKASLASAKDKVNLRCSITIMQGVVDEYKILKENEVLVGNGRITGEVLVLRSPCSFPGDIQKVTAIPGIHDEAYACLNQVLVFSSKGSRPVPDKLAGGDLDGDLYFVIDEPRLVDTVRPAEPHNFGSMGVPKSIATQFPFRIEDGHIPSAPNLSQQLGVFERLLSLGNLVSESSNAWLGVVDVRGVGDSEALKLAELNQHALDARKASLLIDKKQLDALSDLLDKSYTPNYKRKGAGKKSNSLVGVLFNYWRYYMNCVDILIEKAQPRSSSSGIDIDPKENEELRQEADSEMLQLDESKKRKLNHQQDIVNRYCIACFSSRCQKKCPNCAIAWLCASQKCDMEHSRRCSQRLWISKVSDIAGEELVFNTATELVPLCESDTCSMTSSEDTVDQSPLADNIFEHLLKIVFGQEEPRCDAPETRIDWRFLDRTSLSVLEYYAKLEFKEDLRKGHSDAKRRFGGDWPHIWDVFTMDPQAQSQNSQLAVLVPDNRTGLLMWRDKYRNFFPRDPPSHLSRVGSLASTHRILDSLSMSPIAGSLMDCAMRRDPTSLVDAVSQNDLLLLEPQVSSSLNVSQQRAVATILNPNFNEGFFLILGGPGSGKSWMLSMMVFSNRGGLVVAPSNAAVANIALKLLSLGHFNVSNLLVYGENCDQSVHFLSPIHRARRYQTFQKEYETSSRKEELLNEFIEWLQLKSKASIKDNEALMKEVGAHCPRIDDSRMGQENLLDLVASSEVKVVLCTLNTCGSLFLRKACRGKFDTLFMDEAAQCPEAEFYIATTFPGIKRMVVVGDPKQLNATVLNLECEAMGYGESWMKHIHDNQAEKVHFLDIQYRCHPMIMKFSNKQFYSSSIRTAKSVIDRQPVVNMPLLFVDTSNFAIGEERDGLSWKNHGEAETVRRILCCDKDILAVQKSVKHATCMIITPYRAQAELLRKELNKVKKLKESQSVRVATVDSFQGQEGDIVIFSAVRTGDEKHVGYHPNVDFTDHPQRINVALTRARHILRVVGDVQFWAKRPPSSILSKFVDFCAKNDLISSGGQKNDVWRKPDWKIASRCKWQPAMTSKFHHSLRELSQMDKNVAFNTLLAVAMPDKAALCDFLHPRNSEKPCWQTSSLKTYEKRLSIVWAAKGDQDGKGDKGNRPVIEAHFAGPYHKCLHFQQTHPLLPHGACRVKRDYSIDFDITDDSNYFSQNIDVSWNLTDSIGDAMLSGSVRDELPEGCFNLDPLQKKVLEKKPPLLLESRSGTGKTNVLFQHAVAYARGAYDLSDLDEVKPILFVTVSPKLQEELQKRYNEIERLEKVALPRVKFFSLRKLLNDLLIIFKINKDISKSSSFLEYIYSRKSHVDFEIDLSEAENEIGGVIMGSLEAAKSGEPLSDKEYFNSKRSNIANDTEFGVGKRARVYKMYLSYRKWKLENKRFDIHDVVLDLINKFQMLPQRQFFSSAYLDEIQDFTSSAVFLICNIAGKANLHWVCAGDTAQMISPGCSFTFDGLKQVMLAVEPGIESKLKKEHVIKLAKNYRVTKDVLFVSNSILKIAKDHFPHNIECSTSEVSVKDLGTKVLLCDWDTALRKTVNFGLNQALIYTSTTDPNGLAKTLNEWQKDHPFILTSLESKGLEFEDVVVAFDVERKAWEIVESRISSLKLLRELYVAITRAKRRVVILLKKGADTMQKFFVETLKDGACDIIESDAEVAMLEFDRKTTLEQWYERGEELFRKEQYPVAASCFKRAGSFAWFHYAQGKHLEGIGQKENGKESYRSSAHSFFEEGNYKQCLELLETVMEFPPWNPKDDFIYERSRVEEPRYFSREKGVRFALSRNKWQEISLDDLEDSAIAHLIGPHREKKGLKELVASFSANQREKIEHSLPSIIGDYYFDAGDYSKATKLFIQGEDFERAEKTTNVLVGMPKSSNNVLTLSEVAKLWCKSSEKAIDTISRNSDTHMLLQLFDSPINVAKSNPEIYYRKFGRELILRAFENANAPTEELHYFSRNGFDSEVEAALESKYSHNLVEALMWYSNRGDTNHAKKLAGKRIKYWNNDELLGVVLKFEPTGLAEEAERRNILLELVNACLVQKPRNIQLAIHASDKMLISTKMAEDNMDELLATWEKCKSDAEIAETLGRKQARPPGPKTILLLNLFSDPKNIHGQNAKFCMKFFGARVVELAVRKSISGAREMFDVLQKFDAKAFNHLRPQTQESKDSNKNGKQNNKNSNGSKFAAGDRVRIHGIQSQRELNGQEGNVQSILKDGRIGVRIDGRKKNISLKASNLQKVNARPNTKIFGPSSSFEDTDSSDDDSPRKRQSKGNRAKSTKGSIPRKSDTTEKKVHTPTPKAKSKATTLYDSDSSDGSIPPLFDRAHSSSDDSSDSSGIPDLLPRSGAAQGDSSDSSDESLKRSSTRNNRTEGLRPAAFPPAQSGVENLSESEDSSSDESSLPPLTNKHSSSDDDDDDMPGLLGRDSPSASSSDDSDNSSSGGPRRGAVHNKRRGGRGGRVGRGGRGGRGRGKGRI